MNAGNFLILSLFLFSCGIYGILTRRNAIGLLISVELMLNAGAMNFVVFNRYFAPMKVDGQIMAIFVMALAAAEVLVGMAILVTMFRMHRSIDVSKMDSLRL